MKFLYLAVIILSASACLQTTELTHGTAGSTQLPPLSTDSGPQLVPVQDVTASSLTADQLAFIKLYVSQLSFMVYFDEASTTEDVFVKAAITKANEYLTGEKLDVIDAAQIAKLKEDKSLAYAEETGTTSSLIQWLAQKLNADIYVEISGQTQGMTKKDKHYGQASIDIKAYETSTAVLMGSVSYTNLDWTYSTSSQETAKLNAIQIAVQTAMPKLVAQVRENMEKALYQGIRYEIIIQKPLGDRLMARFWQELGAEVENIKALSQTEEEVHYLVWYIGTADQLKNLIYMISETISGLEYLELVYARGKSLTFNTNS